jgi:hypothetical protein
MILGTMTHARPGTDPLEGLWQGYDGEWVHVSRQLVALAEAIPAEKFAWRPAPGVRSTSEVFMHIALANFYLLSITGPKMPDDLKSADMEKTVTAKPEVIQWLKRSLEAVKTAHADLKVRRRPAQSQGLRPRCHRGWHVPPHHRPRQRAHGATGGLRTHERDCAAVVGRRREIDSPSQLVVFSALVIGHDAEHAQTILHRPQVGDFAA